jgi:hypothetical protein
LISFQIFSNRNNNLAIQGARMDSDSDPQDVDLLALLFSDEDFSEPSIHSGSSDNSTHHEITCEECKAAARENEIPACPAATMVGSTDHVC